MTQNSNVCVTPGDVVRASMLALLDTLRIVFQIPLDLLRFVWILGLCLISGSLRVCWKLLTISFVILWALIKEFWRTETKEEARARWKRVASEIRRKFVAWLKSLWRGVIRFVVFIGKCFRFLWKSCLFLIYLLSFCSDRLEALAGSLAPIADDTDDNVDEYAEDDSAVYEEGDYDDFPAEEDEYVDPSDEELEGDEEYDEDNMDSDR